MIKGDMVRGALVGIGDSLWDRIIFSTKEWLLIRGRFYPLYWIHVYPIGYFIKSEVINKTMALSVVSATVILFARLIRSLTQSSALAFFSALVIPVFFQFRHCPDPITCYTFTLPMLFLLVALSLNFFQEYLETKRQSKLILSTVFHVSSLLFYEVSYVFCIVHVILAFAYLRNIRATWKATRAILFSTALIIAIPFLARTHLNPYYEEDNYKGVQVTFDLIKNFKAILMHFSAAFPLSYFIREKTHFWVALRKSDLIGLSIFFSLCFSFFKKIDLQKGKATLFWVGVCFAFFPAFIVGMTGHRDDVISWGYGMSYTPVYFQYFGMYLLIFLGFYSLRTRFQNQRIQDSISLVVCLLTTIVATINLGQNRLELRQENAFFLYPRKVLQAAIESGFLSEVPDKATILRNGRFPSDHAWLFSNFASDLSYNVVEPDAAFVKTLAPETTDRADQVAVIDTSKMNLWALTYSYDAEKGREGNVFLSKLNSIAFDSKTLDIRHLNTRGVKMFQFKTHESQEFIPAGGELDFLKIIPLSHRPPIQFRSFDVKQYETPISETPEHRL